MTADEPAPTSQGSLFDASGAAAQPEPAPVAAARRPRSVSPGAARSLGRLRRRGPRRRPSAARRGPGPHDPDEGAVSARQGRGARRAAAVPHGRLLRALRRRRRHRLAGARHHADQPQQGRGRAADGRRAGQGARGLPAATHPRRLPRRDLRPDGGSAARQGPRRPAGHAHRQRRHRARGRSARPAREQLAAGRRTRRRALRPRLAGRLDRRLHRRGRADCATRRRGRAPRPRRDPVPRVAAARPRGRAGRHAAPRQPRAADARSRVDLRGRERTVDGEAAAPRRVARGLRRAGRSALRARGRRRAGLCARHAARRADGGVRPAAARPVARRDARSRDARLPRAAGHAARRAPRGQPARGG